MSKSVAAVVTLIGPLMRVKLDPRIGAVEDGAALADAVIAGRREREAAQAAARETAS